jgi:HK97 family phage major capsid protein
MPSTAIEDRVREVSGQISATHAEAQRRWAAFSEARDRVAQTDGAAADPSNPLFEAAEAASRAYDETAGQLDTLRAARDGLLRLSNGDGPPEDGNGPTDGPAGFTVGDTLLAELRQSAGARALQSDDYQALRARGAFTVTGRKSVEAVLLRRAIAEDGANLSREALLEAMQRGDALSSLGMLAPSSRQATLVTGAGTGTSAGVLVRPDALPGITVPLRTRPLRLVDLITVGRTDSDEVSYVSMTGFTNAAAETAEATASTGTSGTKPESGLTLAEATTTVRTIAHWIPATKRALSDAGQLRTLIESILRLGLDLRLDQQIATGDGVGENLRGIYNTTGIGAVTRRTPSTTVNLGTIPETALDVLHRAITAIRLAFFEPNAIGIHPSDFEVIRLARQTAGTANAAGGAGTYGTGGYLMGDPMTGDGNLTIWGLRPVVSAAFTAGLPIVGDWTQIVMWLREGTQVLASDSHMDFFIRNLVAILAEFRAAMGVLAPAAFCTAAIA